MKPYIVENEELMKEWDWEKNNAEGLNPEKITEGSNKKIWWKCERNHSWYTLPSVRINGSKCPKCNDNKTSFPEQAILHYINQYFPDAIHRYKKLGFELDIYIPSIETAIEYDGAYFHKKQKPEKENFKNQQCNENNITLIRIREYGLCSYENCICIFRKDNYSKQDLNAVIKVLFNHLKINNADIDVQRDNVAILEQYKFLRLKNSLAVKFPEITAEWHPTKNGNLKPEQFNYGADTKVWWKCSKGHEWQARINQRVKEHGCPVCAGQKVLSGYNDFESYCKNNNLTNLLKEWNYDKNNKVPNEYTWCSGKKVWWKCSKGHEWQTTIAHRISRTECPCCSNRKVIQGFNDFDVWCKQNNRTELLKEWDYEENNKMKITPQNISFGSHKKVHWICKNGHKWVAAIYSRVHGNSCAVCSGKRLLTGYNDLETFCNQNSKKQYLLKEWNYIRNNINPKDVTAHCNKKVWWVCNKCNYEWEATVSSRVRGNGCKQCGMQRTLIAKSKMVKCIETNQVYSSLTEAERQTKIERRLISDSCKDKQKTAGGYHWMFADKYKED